jgi:pimeloyl-ACP methyl ester carboxylesterase
MFTVTSSDTTTLAGQAWGDADDPVVVLVHGLGMSVESWGAVPELLAGDHRVLAYDLRGHGSSGAGAHRDYSLDAHGADLEAVLDAVVEPGRRAVLVGSSLGGGIIVHAAHQDRLQQVAGVVFAGSGASGITVPGLPARGLPDPVAAGLRTGWLQLLRLAAVAAKHLGPVVPLSDRATRRAAFTDDTPQPVIEQTRADFVRTRREALARTTLASVSHNGVRHASRLAVPALVLHGDRDPEVPNEEARALVDRLPDAELVTFPGRGHMLALTNPGAVAEHVRRWTDRTGARAEAPSSRTGRRLA